MTASVSSGRVRPSRLHWPNILGPILAALIGGPLAALAFRYLGVPAEVGEHDARAIEIDEDLQRWVRDRDRVLFNDLRDLTEGLIEEARRLAEPPDPIEGPDILVIGTAAELMRAALHEYRDEATHKVREFAALARSEGWMHRRQRRRRKAEPPTLPRPVEIAARKRSDRSFSARTAESSSLN